MLLKVIHPLNELLGLSGDTLRDHVLLTCIFLISFSHRGKNGPLLLNVSIVPPKINMLKWQETSVMFSSWLHYVCSSCSAFSPHPTWLI